MDSFTPANKALFDGNRGDIPQLVADTQETGRTLWLMAAAADNEDDRLAFLARIHAAGDEPYASMAQEILEREKYFAAEIARSPKWQMWLKENKTLILRSLIAAPILIFVLWMATLFIFPPVATPTATATLPNRAAGVVSETETPTAIPTATVTPLPIDQSSVANYMPIGSLRVLNVEYPTSRAVSAGTTLAQAPAGSAFVAIQYEFTCGTAQTFCDAPPQAQLGLELSDASLGIISSGGLTLRGSAPIGRVTSGSSINVWIVFAIPQNQSPHRLLIGFNSDDDPEIDASLVLDLPR